MTLLLLIHPFSILDICCTNNSKENTAAQQN